MPTPEQKITMAVPANDKANTSLCIHCGKKIELHEYGPPINDVLWVHPEIQLVWCRRLDDEADKDNQ